MKEYDNKDYYATVRSESRKKTIKYIKLLPEVEDKIWASMQELGTFCREDILKKGILIGQFKRFLVIHDHKLELNCELKNRNEIRYYTIKEKYRK